MPLVLLLPDVIGFRGRLSFRLPLFLNLSLLLFIFPAVPFDLHTVVDGVLVPVHVLHVSESLPTQVTGEVPYSEVDRHSVSVEIKLSLELLATVLKEIMV